MAMVTTSPNCYTLTLLTLLAGAWDVARRFVPDSDAQDLVEYALLCAFVGLLGVAAWGLIEGRLGEAYGRYDTRQQALWEPSDPASPPSP